MSMKIIENSDCYTILPEIKLPTLTQGDITWRRANINLWYGSIKANYREWIYDTFKVRPAGAIAIKTLPNETVKPHRDILRRAVINIPVSGDFTNSGCMWYNEPQDNIVAVSSTTRSILMNVHQYHAPWNVSNQERVVFSCSYYPPMNYDVLLEKYLEGNLLF